MRVLISLDGSELAERVLDTLAPWLRTWEAEVVLLTILDPRDTHEAVAESGRPVAPAAGIDISPTLGGVAIQPSPAVIIDRGRALEAVRVNTEDELRTAAGKCLQDVAVSVHAVFAEDAAEGIAAFVPEHAIDFVAMSTHGRSGISQALLGSVAGAVVRHCPVPVILIGPEAAGLLG